MSSIQFCFGIFLNLFNFAITLSTYSWSRMVDIETANLVRAWLVASSMHFAVYPTPGKTMFFLFLPGIYARVSFCAKIPTHYM